jgi:hypothetical protein
MIVIIINKIIIISNIGLKEVLLINQGQILNTDKIQILIIIINNNKNNINNNMKVEMTGEI